MIPGCPLPAAVYAVVKGKAPAFQARHVRTVPLYVLPVHLLKNHFGETLHLSIIMRQDTDQSARCAYLDMAWRFAEFFIKSHRPSEAIPLLEKAEAVAKDMNEIEAGRWEDHLKSITNKLTTLKENANK